MFFPHKGMFRSIWAQVSRFYGPKWGWSLIGGRCGHASGVLIWIGPFLKQAWCLHFAVDWCLSANLNWDKSGKWVIMETHAGICGYGWGAVQAWGRTWQNWRYLAAARNCDLNWMLAKDHRALWKQDGALLAVLCALAASSALENWPMDSRHAPHNIHLCWGSHILGNNCHFCWALSLTSMLS